MPRSYPRVWSAHPLDKRFSAGKPLLGPMPPGDVVLAELPAEEDGLAVTDRREVDQAGIGIAHHDARVAELADDRIELALGLLHRRDELLRGPRAAPAAVARALPEHPRQRRPRGHQ